MQACGDENICECDLTVVAMIALNVISLSMIRLNDALSIYSSNFIDPRVELVGIISPLDKIFGTFSSTTCLYHTFDDASIVLFLRDGLYFLFAEFSFNFFSC